MRDPAEGEDRDDEDADEQTQQDMAGPIPSGDLAVEVQLIRDVIRQRERLPTDQRK